MANDGSLVFDTKINDSGFESGVSNLKKGVKGLGEQMEDTTEKFDDGLENNNKSMITLKNTAKIVGTYIAGKLFKDALTKGVEFNAMIESYTTSFEVMTGSAEKAEEIVSRLQKIGASTPFEFEDLASATQLLMNFGFSADDAIDSFSKLGDISQGNADKLNSIARAYGKMNSAQKVSLEDINMMIDVCHAI